MVAFVFIEINTLCGIYSSEITKKRHLKFYLREFQDFVLFVIRDILSVIHHRVQCFYRWTPNIYIINNKKILNKKMARGYSLNKILNNTYIPNV